MEIKFPILFLSYMADDAEFVGVEVQQMLAGLELKLQKGKPGP